MRYIKLVICLCVTAFAGYVIYSELNPCLAPVTYKIGVLDPRFGVTQAQFIKDLNQAGGIWSSAMHKQLFVYDPKGNLTVNLVYDTRQQTTQEEQRLNSNIDQTKSVAQSVKQQYSSLQDSYQKAQQEYTVQLAQYNQALNTYNANVDYWNSRGGAPKDEYLKLQNEKSSLSEQRSSVETKRQDVNQLADQINSLIDKYNLLVNHINTDVHTINNDGLTGTQFEEGEYVSDNSGRRINIYQFDNQTYFIRVLAHELGHSLGLDHNNNPDSIMNPVNQSKSLVLSPEDLQELKMECRVK